METQIITIPVTTDMDGAQLLDIVNTQISQMISDEIESYGYEAEVDERVGPAARRGRGEAALQAVQPDREAVELEAHALRLLALLPSSSSSSCTADRTPPPAA